MKFVKKIIKKLSRVVCRPALKFKIRKDKGGYYFLQMLAANGQSLMISSCFPHKSRAKALLCYFEAWVTAYGNDKQTCTSECYPRLRLRMKVTSSSDPQPYVRMEAGSNYVCDCGQHDILIQQHDVIMWSESYCSETNANHLKELIYDYAAKY